MKNIYIKYITIAVCGLMAACVQDKSDRPADRTPVGFTSGIATRAADGMWQDGDQTGIFMVAANRQLSDAAIIDGAANIRYVASAGASSALTPASTDETIYFPIDGGVDFVAYYPYTQSVVDYTVGYDASDQSAAPAPNLLYSDNARNRDKNDPQVELTFRHATARMIVNITLNNEFAGETVESVRFVGFASEGGFSLVTGAWTTGTAAEPIVPFTDGAAYTAHLIPQPASQGRMITVLVGGTASSYIFPEDMAFEAGMSYTIGLTVGRTGILEAAVTIAEWDVAALPDGEADQADQLNIVWEGYNDDDDFTAIEILDANDATYASEVTPNSEGTASVTKFIGLDLKTLDINHLWIYYMGNKVEVPRDYFTFSVGVLTIADYHIVAKREHLENISSSAASRSAFYVQVCDIDLGGNAAPWKPIGTLQRPFSGVYDGRGYKIENIYVNKTTTYAALFGYCTNSTLKNIRIASGSVTGTYYVAGICGENRANGGSATVEKCFNAAVISGVRYVGGVCGDNVADKSGTATVIDCGNTGLVTSTETLVGGICGWNFSTNAKAAIVGCTNHGEVIGGSESTGGVCGSNQSDMDGDASVERCTNYAAITGAGKYVGGICGVNVVEESSSQSAQAIIYACANFGTVTGGKNLVGGICAHNNAVISKCSNVGTISGKAFIGGICGENDGSILICSNRCDIFAFSIIGGVCGVNYLEGSVISECYSVANITGETQIGGIAGWNYQADIVDSFWDMNKTGTTPVVAAVENMEGGSVSAYRFGAGDWPGLTDTPGYWNLYSDGGNWISLGEWRGTPEDSDYPVLMREQ